MQKKIINYWQQSLVFLLEKTLVNQQAITLIDKTDLLLGKISLPESELFFTNIKRHSVLVAPFVLSCGTYLRFPLFMQAELTKDLILHAGKQPYPWCPYDFLEPYANTDFILGNQDQINKTYSLLEPFNIDSKYTWQQQYEYGLNFIAQATSNSWQNLAKRYNLNIEPQAAIIWLAHLQLDQNFTRTKPHKQFIYYLKTQNLNNILNNLKQEPTVIVPKEIDRGVLIKDPTREDLTYEQKQILQTCIHNAHKDLFVESVMHTGKTLLINMVIAELQTDPNPPVNFNIIYIEKTDVKLLTLSDTTLETKSITFNQLPLNIDWLIVEHAELIEPIIGFTLLKIAKRHLIFGNSTLTYPTPIPGYIELHLLQSNQLMQVYDEFLEYGLLLTTGNLAKIAKSLYFNLQLTTKFCGNETMIACYKTLTNLRYIAHEKNQKNIIGIKIISYHEQFLSSIKNQAEVIAIMTWLKKNKILLESLCNDSLQNIITMVTPFYGQLQALKQALCIEKLILDVQFMQQPLKKSARITIISLVYHKTDFNKLLFNQGTSILKQLLENTREQIIIFGDLRIFDYDYNDPVSIFGKFIYQVEQIEEASFARSLTSY